MTVHRFTVNEVWNAGIPARIDAGYRMLSYTGSLGGGTLSIATIAADKSPVDGSAIQTPIANGTLKITNTDTDGNVIKQLTFQSCGTIVVTLAGATAPDCLVVIE